eukprot:GAHX01000957.1.p1 GENE.GAHX01000957.1~~GAHX01000957.1.p1  ORF type:complete len:328 (-),score=29.11 GAHX01000957.1:31-1014(-)
MKTFTFSILLASVFIHTQYQPINTYEHLILLTLSKLYDLEESLPTVVVIMKADLSPDEDKTTIQTLHNFGHIYLENLPLTRPTFYQHNNPIAHVLPRIPYTLQRQTQNPESEFLQFERFVMHSGDFILYRMSMLNWLVSSYIRRLFVLNFNQQPTLKLSFTKKHNLRKFYENRVDPLLNERVDQITTKLAHLMYYDEDSTEIRFPEDLKIQVYNARFEFPMEVLTFEHVIEEYMSHLNSKMNDGQKISTKLFEGLVFANQTHIDFYKGIYLFESEWCQNALTLVVSTVHFMVMVIRELLDRFSRVIDLGWKNGNLQSILNLIRAQHV